MIVVYFPLLEIRMRRIPNAEFKFAKLQCIEFIILKFRIGT